MVNDNHESNQLNIEYLNQIKDGVFNTLVNEFPDIVLIFDEEGRIVYVSRNTFSYFDIQTENGLLGKNFQELATSDYKEKIKKDLNQAKEGKSLSMFEYEFYGRNGSKFIGELSLSHFIHQKDNKKYFLGIIRDITNQKIIEIELRENKQMLQLVMDNIPQLISWKDVNSTYLGCNKNFARIAGLNNPVDIIGKTDYELPWKISEAESFFETDQLVINTNKPEYHIIEPQLQADGKQAWLDTNKIPLHNSKEEVVGIICTYEDITERVNSDTALKNSELKYKEAYNRAEFYKDVFAHDVSNILQGILFSVELCRYNSKESRKVKDLENFFDIIEDQVSRGANLVSNVRKISSIDDIGSKLEKVEVCNLLNVSIENIKKSFSKRKITFSLKKKYEYLYVQANHLILDIFNNILYNAVKHNKRPTVKIAIDITKKFIENESVIKLEFKDNGFGIPDAQKLSIFERNTIESKNFNRIGLGLSLVKRLIENYNGEIWVEDRIEGDYTQGSNFVILIREYID